MKEKEMLVQLVNSFDTNNAIDRKMIAMILTCILSFLGWHNPRDSNKKVSA